MNMLRITDLCSTCLQCNAEEDSSGNFFLAYYIIIITRMDHFSIPRIPVMHMHTKHSNQ